ncbi:MAG: nucleotidyltransferase domain-containing protein [Nitrospirae bacterium]|nr:nucleotidyltransferase domain-containing protein [Nitrospirota bacterium]
MEDDALDYFVRRIREQLGIRLKRVILFGSRARGDEAFASDYDCLVVVDEASAEVKDIIDAVAGDTLYEYNAVFSAFPVSQEKLNHEKYNPLLINISKEGITL